LLSFPPPGVVFSLHESGRVNDASVMPPAVTVAPGCDESSCTVNGVVSPAVTGTPVPLPLVGVTVKVVFWLPADKLNVTLSHEPLVLLADGAVVCCDCGGVAAQVCDR